MTKEQFIEQIAQSQEPLRRFLLVLCGGDGFRADDIAQESVIKAYMSYGSFEGRSKFSTWLFRIAYNCFYDSRPKNGKTVSLDILNIGLATEAVRGPTKDAASGQCGSGGHGTDSGRYIDESTAADRRYEYQQLYLAIDALSEAEKAVTLLFYMEEKPIKEIEQITGMPSGTIRSHLSRARRHLKEYLKHR